HRGADGGPAALEFSVGDRRVEALAECDHRQNIPVEGAYVVGGAANKERRASAVNDGSAARHSVQPPRTQKNGEGLAAKTRPWPPSFRPAYHPRPAPRRRRPARDRSAPA